MIQKASAIIEKSDHIHEWQINRMYEFASPSGENMIAVQFVCDSDCPDGNPNFKTAYGWELKISIE